MVLYDRGSDILEGKYVLNLEGKWSLPPFHRAQNMDQKCIIVEFYGGLLLIKNGYPTKYYTLYCPSSRP